MSEKRKKDIPRIKELESINLATEDIRDLVVQTKMEVEKDNELLAKQNNEELKKFNIKSVDVVGAIGAGKTALIEKIVESVANLIGKSMDLADQAIEDKDKKNELKYSLKEAILKLEEIKLQALSTGKGSSITKVTICGLVAFIVGSVFVKWLITSDLTGVQNVVPVITPLIGMLIGSYGTGKTIQKVMEIKNGRKLQNPEENEDIPAGFRSTEVRPKRNVSTHDGGGGKR